MIRDTQSVITVMNQVVYVPRVCESLPDSLTVTVLLAGLGLCYVTFVLATVVKKPGLLCGLVRFIAFTVFMAGIALALWGAYWFQM